MKSNLILLLICALVGLSFTSERVLILVYPSYFPSPSYNLSQNPLVQERIDLGQMLFFDPILSKDLSISCASCHSPYNAFAHTDHDLSHGMNDSIGTRNAPALFNLAWQETFMWDGAINHLDMQSLAPLSHPSEMGENIKDVVEKLLNTTRYRTAFYKAWSDSVPTGERFLKSITQFQLTLVSATAKYDRVRAGEDVLSPQEAMGYGLFKDHCSSCHTEPLFSSYGFANNGLPVDSTLDDHGRYGVTKNPEDSLLFKTPSLRNLSYTFPYMHDGRFSKLNEVLNHYNRLKPGMIDESMLSRSLNLSSKDKADLISFLMTLNDTVFVFNPQNKYPQSLQVISKN